jgi:hypothetical protein
MRCHISARLTWQCEDRAKHGAHALLLSLSKKLKLERCGACSGGVDCLATELYVIVAEFGQGGWAKAPNFYLADF